MNSTEERTCYKSKTMIIALVAICIVLVAWIVYDKTCNCESSVTPSIEQRYDSPVGNWLSIDEKMDRMENLNERIWNGDCLLTDTEIHIMISELDSLTGPNGEALPMSDEQLVRYEGYCG